MNLKHSSAFNIARLHVVWSRCGRALLVASVGIAVVTVSGCRRQETTEPAPVKEPDKAVTGSPVQLPSPTVDNTTTTVPKKRVFRDDDVVATINGVAFRARDVIAMTPGSSQQISIDEMKDAVNRHVIEEAIFRKATSQGVDLTAEEQKRLAAIVNVTPNPAWTAEELAFRQADAAIFQRGVRSDLLLDHLLRAQNVPQPKRPVSNAEVRAYYDQHRNEYPPLPEGADPANPVVQKIYQEIRNRLMGLNIKEYNRVKVDYARQLQAQSGIEVSYSGK